jgi:hypothetical protein
MKTIRCAVILLVLGVPLFSQTLSPAQRADQYGRPDARPLLQAALPGLNGAARTDALRRLVLLDLQAGDRQRAETDLAAYRAAGGTDLAAQLPTPIIRPVQTVPVPGPLHSFSRMAALSPDLKPDELLPALARNIIVNGYRALGNSLEQTEYLKLVYRYLSQARELEKLADASKKIVIETCDSPKTGDLLRIIGYRMRGGCGGEVILETVNATRAFVTIDSGFPIAELEQALRNNRTFSLDYSPTQVPVVYGPEFWTAGEKPNADSPAFIDAFLGDQSTARLYLGLTKLDPETSEELRKRMPLIRLKAFAHVIDFFGGMFLIRDGKAMVPGARSAWEDLAGVSPDKGAEFYEKLMGKDDGWLTSYFDALMRIEGPAQTYLTDGNRMKRFYTALRGRVTSPGPARPVFRSNTDLMLLTTRLRLEAGGQPHIPGGIDVWKRLFTNHPDGKYDGKLTKAATGWKNADDLLEALFGLSRKVVENEPLKMYLAIGDLDRQRATPLDPTTVDRLLRSYRQFGSQYSIFAEAGSLRGETILAYLDAATNTFEIGSAELRADATGTLQGLAGLWQIAVRNGLIADGKADELLSTIAMPFAKVRSNADVFEAGRGGIKALLAAAGPGQASAQDKMMDLVAGTMKPGDPDAHAVMVQELNRVFESQKLISLKTILDLADHTEAVAKGEKLNATLLNRLATRLKEIELPRASLTSAEKSAISAGFWAEKHIADQRKLNLRQAVEKAGNDALKLRDARGLMTPLLRDTLVGFNYLYYAPPSAQVLKTNALFVRNHDFVGYQTTGAKRWKETELTGSGWPASAGGRLGGSLSSTGYALAEAEQNFLIPSQEQALIWGDLVPQMILSATSNRFWNVTADEMHWVGLHMRAGETALAESVLNPAARTRLIAVLDRQAAPNRVARVVSLLAEGDLRGATENVTPAELLQIGAATLAGNSTDSFLREARSWTQSHANINMAAMGKVFGTPKPTLTNSYKPELLFVRTFPTLMGYSSRVMAESWESNLLYFAALADELQLPPGRLNLLVPRWTASTVEHIFATHLEDWPALLRSLRKVGEDLRHQDRQALMSAAVN